MKLQERDVLALGNRIRELRLHFRDVGVGEPADEVDVVDGEVDDDADVGHARRERADTGDGDGKNVLIADRVLDRLNRRVEPLDMTDHQGDARVPRRRYDCVSLFHRRCDRLFHQHVHATFDAAERQFPMQMGGRRDRDSIDTLRKQRLNAAERRAAERARNEIALLAIGIGHADEPDGRQIGEDAGMIAAHHADAHYTYAQQTVGVAFGGLHHDGRVPPSRLP